MSSGLPAITGLQLIKLLEKDGWTEAGRRTHGISMQKKVNEKFLVTVIPTKKNKSIAEKTLHQILGSKQTQIGRKGLDELIKKYGL